MQYKDMIKKFLDEKGRLTAFPSKRKMKVYALLYLSEKITEEKIYSERELNELLNEWHTFHDPATLRREMYNAKILNRDPGSGTYMKEKDIPSAEDIMKKFG